MSNLSQLQFPGMGSNLPSFSVQGKNPKHEVRDDYTSAHSYPTPRNNDPLAAKFDEWESTRIPIATKGLDAPGLAGYGPEQEEWVPTERLTTNQDKVNPKAVQHQVKNANPLGLNEDPYMASYTEEDGKESFLTMDGNHRANAALVRGQLLIPARVRRVIPEGTDVRTLGPKQPMDSYFNS